MSRAVSLLSGRYLISQRREKFVRAISVIAVLGVALGVAALIVVLAVMTGFDQHLQEKIIGANPHLTVRADGRLESSALLVSKIEGIEGVVGASPFVQGQALLSADKLSTGILLKGIDPDKELSVTRVEDYLISGSLDMGVDGQGVVVGSVMAQQLGLLLGSTVKVVTPQSREPRHLQVTGLFSSGMYDIDAHLALVSLTNAQKLFGMGQQVTGVGVRVEDPNQAAEIKSTIQRSLGFPYWTLTWMEQNRNLFAAIKLEKVVMFLILTLIVLVACFNIVATLLIMVTERIRDIGILQALGATRGDIRRIFTRVGMVIGGSGIFLGVVVGVALCAVLQHTQLVKLPPDIYYLDHLPALLLWQDVGVVVVAALVISWLACFYPSMRAASLKPVEALRYE